MSTVDMSDPAAAAAAQAAMEAQLAAVKRFNVEAFTLLGIALAATVLRTYARVSAVGIRNLKPDDYLVWVGAVRTMSSLPLPGITGCYRPLTPGPPTPQIFHGIETGLAYCVGEVAHGLANNGMTDAQRLALDPASMEYHLR